MCKIIIEHIRSVTFSFFGDKKLYFALSNRKIYTYTHAHRGEPMCQHYSYRKKKEKKKKLGLYYLCLYTREERERERKGDLLTKPHQGFPTKCNGKVSFLLCQYGLPRKTKIAQNSPRSKILIPPRPSSTMSHTRKECHWMISPP